MRLVGTSSDLRPMRRAYIRTFTHTGLTTAFGKLKGASLDPSIDILFRRPATPPGPIATPAFIRQIATAYLDAKAKREDADYNLNEPLTQRTPVSCTAGSDWPCRPGSKPRRRQTAIPNTPWLSCSR